MKHFFRKEPPSDDDEIPTISDWGNVPMVPWSGEYYPKIMDVITRKIVYKRLPNGERLPTKSASVFAIVGKLIKGLDAEKPFIVIDERIDWPTFLPSVERFHRRIHDGSTDSLPWVNVSISPSCVLEVRPYILPPKVTAYICKGDSDIYHGTKVGMSESLAEALNISPGAEIVVGE